MSKKVSIIMAYYNRLEVLKITLKTISKTKHDNIEIILVDDGSDDSQRCESLRGYCGLDIKILRIDKEEKTWTNPCIPFNRGFQQATGEIILIQNPECLHVGDVISHAVANSTNKNYLTFSCYSVDAQVTSQFSEVTVDQIADIIALCMKSHVVISKFLGWYNHPTVRPYAYHFCSVLTKKNISELGGFDERYASGYGFDDNELLARIKRKGLQIEILPPESGVYVIHQFHPVNPDSRTWKSAGVQRNSKLFHEVTLKETDWKVN